MLHFFKSADCPRNDKGIIKVARGNFKTLFLGGSKTKKNQTFKMDLFKGVTLAKSRHLGLREVKLKEDTFFFSQVKENLFKTKHIAKWQHYTW